MVRKREADKEMSTQTAKECETERDFFEIDGVSCEKLYSLMHIQISNTNPPSPHTHTHSLIP